MKLVSTSALCCLCKTLLNVDKFIHSKRQTAGNAFEFQHLLRQETKEMYYKILSWPVAKCSQEYLNIYGVLNGIYCLKEVIATTNTIGFWAPGVVVREFPCISSTTDLVLILPLIMWGKGERSDNLDLVPCLCHLMASSRALKLCSAGWYRRNQLG